jgi:hypothetical protein
MPKATGAAPRYDLGRQRIAKLIHARLHCRLVSAD